MRQGSLRGMYSSASKALSRRACRNFIAVNQPGKVTANPGAAQATAGGPGASLVFTNPNRVQRAENRYNGTAGSHKSRGRRICAGR